MFLEDFVKRLESKISDFKITSKEEEIEEKADERIDEIEERISEFVCDDCGKKFDFSDRKIWSDEDPEHVITICPDCLNKRRQSIKKCSRCGKELMPSDEKFTIKTVFGEKRILCPNCYNKPHLSDNKKLKNRKNSIKWKVVLGVLTIIAVLSLILLLNSIGIL